MFLQYKNIIWFVQSRLRPPFISGATHDKKCLLKETFHITLNAYWPTPSWEHEKTEINISEKDKTVTIKYLGERRPGVALTVVKSFTVDFEVKFPSTGVWTIIIVGKNEDWESKVNVI